MSVFVGQDDWASLEGCGQAERESLIRRLHSSGIGQVVNEADLSDSEDDDDETPAKTPRASSPVKKTARGVSSAASTTSKTVAKGQKVKGQAMDVAAAIALAKKLVSYRRK